MLARSVSRSSPPNPARKIPDLGRLDDWEAYVVGESSLRVRRRRLRFEPMGVCRLSFANAWPPLQDWAIPNTVENRHPPNHQLSLEQQSTKLQCPEREEITKWISKQSREFKPRRSSTTVVPIRLRLTGDDGNSISMGEL
ncbi:hypothetical protein AKJ16_DCAP14770 [Drosera capensis]